MGTRGAIGFRLDGEDKITYNHFDSYPGGLGSTILTEICGKKDWNKVKENVRRIVLVTNDTPPTDAEIAANAKWADLGVSEQSFEDWYCLLREAQGTLEPYMTGELPLMFDSTSFVLDSLFCEYAYIINLDDGVLEFYKGFNSDPNAPGRYASLQRERKGEYFGVALVETVPLSDFPATKRCKTFVNKTLQRWQQLTHEEDE